MANNSRTNRAFAKRIKDDSKQNPEKLEKICAKARSKMRERETTANLGYHR